jgi:preprotein translocase subunit SecY
MLNTLKSIFSIPDLRKKIFFTIAMLAVYRVGAHIPIPFVDSGRIREFFDRLAGVGEGVFSMVDMFTGGAFTNMTIMALGIMPFISAQIILQLMMVVVPRLEKMKKEGEAGQRKIEQWTRYGAVGLAAVQSLGVALFLVGTGDGSFMSPVLANQHFLFIIPGWMIFMLITMISVVAGTTLLMWIGEQITANGIGNGISLLIAASIFTGYPASAHMMYTHLKLETIAPIWVPILIGLGIVTVVAIILIQEGARRIPIQHARRTVGRRVQQATTNYLPLKVNTAGVIPVIFSSAILTLPQTVFMFVGTQETGGLAGLGAWFSQYSPYNLYNAFGIEKQSIFLLLKVANLHTLLYMILTGFFCFFYTAVTFNPVDVAENLKRTGAFIPGYRPGKQTADYIDLVLTRITTVGAVFLVTVALIPSVLSQAFDVHYSYAEFAGGTGLIIVVGVVLDTMKKIESQLLMRHYDGFKIRRQAAASGPGQGGGPRRWSGRRER